jgi:membrane-associated phospholipid phosphatase
MIGTWLHRGLSVLCVCLLVALGLRARVAGAAALPLDLAESTLRDTAWETNVASPSPESFGLGLEAMQIQLDGGATDTPPALSYSARPESAGSMPSLAGFPHRVLRDLGTLATRPLHFDSRDWTRLALGTAAVGVAFVLDNPVRDWVHEDGSVASGDVARRVRPLGTWGGLALAGGLFLGGRLANDPDVASTGADALEAVVISAGLIAPLLKETVGRARPLAGRGKTSNDPFSGGQSFPSGDATEAFALASVISAHTESFGLRAAAWGLAGLVAWDRIRLDAHWTSDVVAAGLIGAAVGDWVVRHHRGDRAAHNRLVIMPLLSPHQVGIEASLEW